MIAQAARVNGRGNERRAERVHLDQRRHLRRIAKVVRVDTLRQGRRRTMWLLHPWHVPGLSRPPAA